MFEFIEQHQKAFIAAAIIIVLGLTGVLVLLYSKSSPQTNTPIVNNQPNYSFLKEDISQEDKYLMLLGKILTEQYGTYSNEDIRGLVDVQNQSTDEFRSQIQKLIDSIPAGKNITTVVDAESEELIKEGSVRKIQMNAITTDETGKQINIQSTVTVNKVGEYWLTSGITFVNK